eukprot:4522387-Pyramimonas_sp.AAC.1
MMEASVQEVLSKDKLNNLKTLDEYLAQVAGDGQPTAEPNQAAASSELTDGPATAPHEHLSGPAAASMAPPTVPVSPAAAG